MEWEFPRVERWAFALIAAAVFSNSTWAAGPTVAFHIAAGHASQTLREFFLQSRVRVLYLSDDLKGVQTHAIGGKLEASEALAQMLKGTGLTYEFDSEYSAVIKRAPQVAAVPQAATTPPSQGEGPDIPVPSGFGDQTKVEEVLVTGSLIRGVVDITSPLISVDRTEMKRTGYATVQDVVRVLPMAANTTRGEVLAGAGNFGRGSSINLRGLGDGATLVLVNGRRQPVAGTQGDFVDVSNMPWSIVDRVEVLPDGGSALYGSDAIAGVVNIILRQKIEGAETQLRYGTTREGAAETMIAQLVGRNWRNGHWLAGYQYANRTELAAADRSYTANADKRALGGRDFRSVFSNPGNVLDPQTLQPVFAIPGGQDGRSLNPNDLLPGVINYQNQFADVELLPEVRTHSVYFTGSQHLSEHVEMFAEGRYGQRELNQRPWIPPGVGGGVLVVPETNPFFVDPFGGAPFVIVAYDLRKDLGPYATGGRTRNYSGTLGLKTEFNRSWQASLAASYGRESLNMTDHGQSYPVALDVALADSNPATAFNPFGDGAHTNASTLAAIHLPFQYVATSELPSIQFHADGRVGPMKAAIGAEYRQENWASTVRADTLGVRRTFLDVRLGRTVAAAFAELSVPLLGNDVDPQAVPRLELSLAGRYEHYNDFGRTFNPKIGLRWTPRHDIKLRASWGTSFRAPNLIDLDTSSNASFVQSLRDPRSTTGRSDVLAMVGGNPDLNEERAETWTAGFDLAPRALPGFQLSVTGYSIDYKAQVIQPGPASNPADVLLQEDQWAAVVTRNPSQSQTDIVCSSGPRVMPDLARCRTSSPAAIFDGRKHNLASTEVTGLDLSLNQAFDTDVGHFNIALNGAYVFHLRRAFTTTSPVVDGVNTVNNTLALRARGTVEWQQRAMHRSGFAANLTSNYTGSYKDSDSLAQTTVDASTTFDLGLRYQAGTRGDWTDNTEFAVNVVNVLDEDPPFIDREWGYDIVNAQPAGRVISAYLSKRW